MIIRRKLISLVDKLFAINRGNSIDNLYNLTKGATMEIIKLIEFRKLCGEGKVMNHWLDVVSGILMRIHKNNSPVKFYMGFIGTLDDRSIINLLSYGELEKIRSEYSTPEDFIQVVKNKLKLQTNKGSEKYADWIKSNGGFLVSNEDYVSYFKFITLSLAGDIDPTSINFDESWKIFSVSGDVVSDNPKNRNIIPNKESIKELLKICINKITENVSYKNEAQNRGTTFN